jgi:acylphosphatase
VRNRPNGAVEALICGPPAAVEALIAEMRPRSAVVDSLEAAERDRTPGDDSGVFIIRPMG